MTGIHHEVRKHIQDCYREINKIACPWDGSEAAALDKMLKHNPSWELSDWLRMVSNYFQSEGTNGARPRQWIPSLSAYARGPLDRFGKLQRISRVELEALVGKPGVMSPPKGETECLCYISATTGKKMVCPYCQRHAVRDLRSVAP